jgi:signal transduction histidine kinase
VDLVRAQIDAARHELTIDVPQETLILEIDPVRIAQAIGNLLENSARYTPEGGHIILRARADGNGIAVEVIDNGPGIDAAHHDHINQPIFTTKRSGSGVGQSVSRQIRALNKGLLTVKTALGTGSELTLRFR